MSFTTISQSHVKWDCIYHIVIVPKYRKKHLYGQVGQRLREIIRELLRQKNIEMIEGAVKPDHVHMVLRIPPRFSVSAIMGFLKGKSAIRLHNEFSKKKSVTQKSFWARGYFVRTIGLDQQMVEEYVRKQTEEDKGQDNNPQMEFYWN
jgi:putative transposase